MNREKLLDIMRFHGVDKPMRGTGINGKIKNEDLEDALGNHFFKKKFADDLRGEDAAHMTLRRRVRPMKAYRFNNLKEADQQQLFEDNNGWVAEKKYDGWRILITHMPGTRLHFFGGNLSTTEFLPIDYTYHLPEMRLASDNIFIIDSEALCYDTVIQQDGYPSTNTREAVAAILGSSPEVALAHQEEATMEFRLFDYIPNFDKSYSKRRQALDALALDLGKDSVLVPNFMHHVDKRRFLQRVWKNGGEGIILKNLSAGFDSGGRKRTHCVKVKKSAAGLIGDTIDAYISGYTLTDVHSFNDEIGGLELSVNVNDEPVVIAVVTNMPDAVRSECTTIKDGMPVLTDYMYGRVLEIDGQEFSTRNRKLMHASVVDWRFRTDKSPIDCKMTEADFGGKF